MAEVLKDVNEKYAGSYIGQDCVVGVYIALINSQRSCARVVLVWLYKLILSVTALTATYIIF